MQSQFDYTFNAAGQITTWQQNNSGLAAAKTYALNYDNADQLTQAALTGSGSMPKSYTYGYDLAGNRTREQINSATTTSKFNDLNQLTAQSPGGLTQFTGSLSKWAVVTVGGTTARLTANATSSGTTFRFDGMVNLTPGTNIVPIVATDVNNNTRTNNYQVTVPSGDSRTLSYDFNGNMLSDGTRNYQWDAANRLVKIWYGPISNAASTSMNYDGLSRRIGIVEKDASGNVTSTKNFVWDGMSIAEERDASNTVTKRFYGQGEQIAGTCYFYTRDHLGSVREMTDSNGTLHARYDYDPYGRLTKTAGDMDADFVYTGHYYHQPSGLYLAPYRAYSADLARWISRDPLEERGGINLYGYIANNPVNGLDELGLNYYFLNDSSAVNIPTQGPQGHAASIVGNPSTGYDYYSKDGITNGNQLDTHQHYDTLDAFWADKDVSGRYDRGVDIPTSPDQDDRMRRFANKHLHDPYQNSSEQSNNCGDLSNGIMGAGGIPPAFDTRFGITVPNRQYNDLSQRPGVSTFRVIK